MAELAFVIPAYNEEALIGQCLESVIKDVERSGADVDIVVVNNASVDRTKEIALSYPGVRVVDDPHFPEAWKAEALAQAKALDRFRASSADIDWTYISPAALIEDGPRTGSYRIGGDQLLVDAHGKSQISVADYAVALLDRLEHDDARRQRITVAY